jgi:Domain of unknown function (DUF4249)
VYRLKFIFIVSWLFILINCNKNLELPPQEAPKLVIWGFLHPDSIPSINLSTTYPLLDSLKKANAAVSNAKVILWENNIPIDTLSEDTIGHYISVDKRPKVGYSYYFTAESAGFPILKTLSDTIPEAIKIIAFKVETPLTFPSVYLNIILRLTLEKVTIQTVLGNQVTYLFGNNKGNSNYAYDQHCEWQSEVLLNEFFYENYDCQSGFSYVFLQRVGEKSENIERGIDISLSFLSPHSQIIAKKLGLFNALNTDSQGNVNVFYEPIFIPFEVENGYGTIFCSNTSSIHVTF